MRNARQKPVIGITAGDPAGIGPEVALKALRAPGILASIRPVLLGPRKVIEYYARLVRLRSELVWVDEWPPKLSARTVYSVDAGGLESGRIPFGQVDLECGRAALEAIRRGVALARQGQIQALVTGPIHKKSAQLAGMQGAGHTEFIAHLCGVSDVRLMLVAPRLKVVHVSTHLSLRAAIDLVKRDRILRTIELGAQVMKRLGVRRPRIGVAGLNPHASDEGLFGSEEESEIAPAVRAAADPASAGWRVLGPLPPDTLFYRAYRGEFDLVVAMYHDQGHVPAKLVAFEDAVNVTAGLPIIRTSVDHGTAFDLAGQNRANPRNMEQAIRLAARLALRT